MESFHERHERLKNYVHNGFRVPLPWWGRYMMGFVYFSIPVVAGWFISQWAIERSEAKIGVHGERLPEEYRQGKLVGSSQDQSYGVLGARMAVSDEETRRRNKKALEKFLRKQRRKQQDVVEDEEQAEDVPSSRTI